jgi:hypothetical protein
MVIIVNSLAYTQAATPVEIIPPLNTKSWGRVNKTYEEKTIPIKNRAAKSKLNLSRFFSD